MKVCTGVRADSPATGLLLTLDVDELEWYIPAAILVEDLQRTLNVINQFLQTPIDLDGKKAAHLLSKKRRRRRRRSPSPDSDNNASDDEPQKKKRKARKKEKEVYKSAQFIEDSDAEYGDMEGFLEKEKVARERAFRAAAAADNGRPSTMKPTGTKKRRRKGTNEGSKTKKSKEVDSSLSSDGESRAPSDSDVEVIATPQRADAGKKHLPRPRPRLRRKDGPPTASHTPAQNS